MDDQQLRTLKEIKEAIPTVICDRKEVYRGTTGPNDDETWEMNREEWLESHLEWIMDSIGIMFYDELEQSNSKEKEHHSLEDGKD